MKNKIIILDTETTDVTSEPWLIQLGYIVCDLDLKEIKRENLFFDTEKDIDLSAMAVHHITQPILAQKLSEDKRTDKEKKALVMKDFDLAFLVAHNSPFDKNVLDVNWIITNEDQWIDTYNIAYSTYTDKWMKHNLQYLRYYLECEFNEVINAHDALSDVIVLMEVFKIMFGEYKEKTLVAWYEVNNKEFLNDFVDETKKGIILREWAFGKYKWQSFLNTFKTDRQYFAWMYNQKKQDWNTKDALFNTINFYLNNA